MGPLDWLLLAVIATGTFFRSPGRPPGPYRQLLWRLRPLPPYRLRQKIQRPGKTAVALLQNDITRLIRNLYQFFKKHLTPTLRNSLLYPYRAEGKENDDSK